MTRERLDRRADWHAHRSDGVQVTVMGVLALIGAASVVAEDAMNAMEAGA